jgi:hypothetical protein
MLEPCEGKSFKHGSEGGYTVVRPFSYPTRGSDVPDLPDTEMWEELAMSTPGLKKAMTTLEFLSQDKEMRALALAREKALRDEISKLSWARKEGRAEGEQKGRVEGKEIGKLEVAKNLLSKDMSVSEISEVTGLPESEIAKLKELKHETANKEAE